jgi:hypothetical protein
MGRKFLLHKTLIADGCTIEATGANTAGAELALRAFFVCKTTNILCESGYDNLDERRRRKLTNIALHVSENENH